MINYKQQHNLINEADWPYFSSVFVKGISGEQKVVKETEDKENVVETWGNVAVMKVVSNQPVEFYLGFATKGTVQYLKHEFKTDLEFGVRVGPDDVLFFVLPKDWSTEVKLELVEVTTEDNDKYKELIVV